jgi:lysophospholipase L1-like esterase
MKTRKRKGIKTASFWLAALALVGTAMFGLAACSGNDGGAPPEIGISDDGYLTVDGEKTGGSLRGEKGADGTNGTDGTDGTDGTNGENGAQGKSAYQSYLELYPEYTKSEKEWFSDMAKGRLDETNRYTLIKNSAPLGLRLTGGSAAAGDGYWKMSAAIYSVDQPVILPIGAGSDWEVSFEAVLCPGGSGGGQFLTSNPATDVNRMAFGCNTNGRLFINYQVDGQWYNNGWDIGTENRNNHLYKIRLRDGVFSLSLDGGEYKGIEYVSNAQGTKNTAASTDMLEDTFSEKLSADMLKMFKSLSGQDFVTMRGVGGSSFALTINFKSLDITTSAIWSHDDEIAAVHPLYGKKIAYLGSSITRGNQTNGKSFVEVIAGMVGNTYLKEAQDGTALADRDNSYVRRLENFDLAVSKPDILVVQFSTNDFAQGATLGTLAAGKDINAIDKTTTVGAIEYIAARTAELSPDTKILFCANPIEMGWGARDAFAAGLLVLKDEIAPKWGFTVLDMFTEGLTRTLTNPTLNGSDQIHVSAHGYRYYFAPRMINAMVEMTAADAAAGSEN